MLLVEKESWSRSPSVSYRKERELTDQRKLIIKPLAKHRRGQVWGDKFAERLNSLEGVESVGFSPDKHLGVSGRDVVAFVVFEREEQMKAALVVERCVMLCWIQSFSWVSNW